MIENKNNKIISFITLGCKVNQYETNAMAQKFKEKGYKVIEGEAKADIYVINTCTVTNMSDRKSRQMLRRMKDINKNAIIVACGCYVQVSKEEVEQIIEEAFAKVKPQSAKDMGLIMKEVTPLLKGKADMKEVSNIIKEKLASI